MTKCSKCNIRIVKHLWLVGERVYCSPRCERGKDGRYGDKTVEKLGVAGFVREARRYGKR